MVSRIVAVCLALTLAGVSVSAAQEAMNREIGVDVGFAYVSPDGGDSFLTIGTPVDARVGFAVGDRATVEPRVSFVFISDVGGDAAYTLDLGTNLTYGLKTFSDGVYLTGGANIILLGAGGESENLFGLNAGVGTRAGSGRFEAFVSYRFENTNVSPAVTQIGVRLGVTSWQ